ncbi:hypothetical protein C4D60_Mb07t25180 [Musa balbisiana]|uniref:Ubiquitin-like domain-containing protein n=1 Tax=Musa balbisiana TaxID=52838 RepID=A0A4S8JJU4_MUSBA|nr:hypothetical protein C4D60_Mb07t25180 [Musa balbisiana]
MVLPKCGTKKVPVDVNASDNVSELRKELQRLYGVFNFHLPTDGYFFIYKQNVMDEDKSFRWHDVKQGDTIEIFNGSVTGGSSQEFMSDLNIQLPSAFDPFAEAIVDDSGVGSKEYVRV